MSIQRFTIDIDIDDGLLAEHDGDESPPPNDIEDWEASDIFRAADEGIVDPHACEIVYYDGEQKVKK